MLKTNKSNHFFWVHAKKIQTSNLFLLKLISGEIDVENVKIKIKEASYE